MVEGLGLRFGRWRSSNGSLGFTRTGGMREEGDLLRDAATKVGEGFTDVGRIIVGLVGVLVPVGLSTNRPELR